MKYQDDYHNVKHKEETRVADKNCQGNSLPCGTFASVFKMAPPYVKVLYLFLVAMVGVFLFIVGSCVHSCMTAPTHEEKMKNDPEYAEIYNRIHHRNLREKRNAERIEAYKDACDELGIPYEE
jgi:hypothetical protein